MSFNSVYLLQQVGIVTLRADTRKVSGLLDLFSILNFMITVTNFFKLYN